VGYKNLDFLLDKRTSTLAQLPEAGERMEVHGISLIPSFH
jgi:hypothetical protein